MVSRKAVGPKDQSSFKLAPYVVTFESCAYANEADFPRMTRE